jgi:DNA polymerase-3 subunit alpha
MDKSFCYQTTFDSNMGSITTGLSYDLTLFDGKFMSATTVKNFNFTSETKVLELVSINRPKDLINKAIELGLSGIAITDHECISSHPEINFYQSEVQKEHPDFKIALGNEIYLTDTRDSGQRYYHFILIAKNKIGHRALRELSSRAWMNSY